MCINFAIGGSYQEIHAPSSPGTILGTVDLPFARDPPHQAFVPAICQHSLQQSNVQQYEHNNIVDPSAIMKAYSNIETNKEEKIEEGNSSETNNISLNTLNEGIALGSQDAKRVFSCLDIFCENNLSREIIQNKETKQTSITDNHIEELRIPDSSSNTGTFSQRTNKKHTSLRRLSESSNLEEHHQQGRINPHGKISNYMDGLMSLNDVLSEGLGTHGDWSARIAAFTYIQSLLKQGSKGLHEVTQNFKWIMKLFLGHLTIHIGK